MTLAQDIARFVASREPFPRAALERACEGMTDAIGVMLAGRDEPVVRATQDMASASIGDDAATLLVDRGRARAIDAALVNATAAHVLAMDDVAGALHPSSSLMSALFAEAECRGASGHDVADAYVAGFETMTALAEREPGSLHDTGWHPTGLFGPVGVAAAIARLRRFDADTTMHALGIAASATGGIQGNFGTPTKALHVGRAAASGLWAARLAAAGVTASAESLDGARGLLATVSPSRAPDLASPFAADPANPRLLTIGLSFKKYPVCYTTHRVVDAAIDLARRHDLDADAIAHVDVRIGRRQAAMARFVQPETVLQAKYSVPYAVAIGLVERKAGIAQLAPALIASDAVARLIGATSVELTDDALAGEPVFASADRVTVTLRDGTVLDSGEVPYARGHALHPWTAAEHRAKFLDGAAATGYRYGERLYERLMALHGLARAGDAFAAPARAQAAA